MRTITSTSPSPSRVTTHTLIHTFTRCCVSGNSSRIPRYSLSTSRAGIMSFLGCSECISASSSYTPLVYCTASLMFLASDRKGEGRGEMGRKERGGEGRDGEEGEGRGGGVERRIKLHEEDCSTHNYHFFIHTHMDTHAPPLTYMCVTMPSCYVHTLTSSLKHFHIHTYNHSSLSPHLHTLTPSHHTHKARPQSGNSQTVIGRHPPFDGTPS